MREFKGHNMLDFPESYVVVDVETTGLDPSRDKLIEVAALKVQDSKVVDSFSSLINPGVPVSDFIAELTGITNEQLENAPLAGDVLNELSAFIVMMYWLAIT